MPCDLYIIVTCTCPTKQMVFNLLRFATYHGNPLYLNDSYLKLEQSKCNTVVYIKYLLAAPDAKPLN